MRLKLFPILLLVLAVLTLRGAVAAQSGGIVPTISTFTYYPATVTQTVTQFLTQTLMVTQTITNVSPVVVSSTSSQTSTVPSATTTGPPLIPSSVFSKGLFVSQMVILNGLSEPSFTSLAQYHFTIVGTLYDPGFHSQDVPITNWVAQAKAQGLKTYVMIASSYANAFPALPTLVSLGSDFLMLDDAISYHGWTEVQIQSFLSAALQLNPNLFFIENESIYGPIQDAYLWDNTGRLYVAEDNYDTKSVIDYNINQAFQYGNGKTPIAWLIFSPGSHAFDCYTNFNTWLSYAQGRSPATFFYWVDPNGNWQANWSLVAAY